MTSRTRTFDGDVYERVSDEASFERWCVNAGWKDAAHFTRDTGCTYTDVAGKWFCVTNNRVFTKGA